MLLALDFMGRRYTYRQLGQMVTRAARGLQSIGVKAGDRVGLCLPNTAYFPIFYFAALKLGAIDGQLTIRSMWNGSSSSRSSDSGTTVMVTC